MSDTKWAKGKLVCRIGECVKVKDEAGDIASLCHIDRRGRRRNPDEVLFTGKLFAAAPDLYEALEHAKEMLEEYETEATGESFNSLMINAALAKARGKT